jgi:hypothetical protein
MLRSGLAFRRAATRRLYAYIPGRVTSPLRVDDPL